MSGATGPSRVARRVLAAAALVAACADDELPGGRGASSPGAGGGASAGSGTSGGPTSTGPTTSGAGGDPGAGGGGAAAAGRPCEVPPGADPSVGRAVSAAGFDCERIPAPLASPRDVLVAEDGAILLSELGAGRVVQWDGNAYAVVAAGLESPIGLREEADGSLLVAEELRGTLARIDRATGARTVVASDLQAVTYLTLGPDGAAYVSSFREVAPTATGIVWRVPLDGGAPSAFATGLDVPEGLAFLGGALHVVEWHLPSGLFRFPPGGGAREEATVLTRDLTEAYGLCEDGEGGWLIGDHAGRVLRVRGDGTSEVVLSGIGKPGGIARSADGVIFVAEFVGFGATGYLIRLTPHR